MRKTTKRMLALVLSTVMAASSFTALGGTAEVYAADDTIAVETYDAELSEVATTTDTRVDASKFKVVLSSTSYAYDGTQKKPAVKITDKKGVELKANRDYTYVYSNNIYPGTASVKITYKGNYKGTATKSFTIKKISVNSVNASQTADSIKLSWKSVSKATLYTIQRKSGNNWITVYSGKSVSATVKNLKANTAYSFVIKAKNGSKVLASTFVKAYTNPAKVTGGAGGLTKKNDKNVITTSTSNSVRLIWNNVKGATGYKIYIYNSNTKSWKLIATKSDGAVACMEDGRRTYTVSRLASAKGYKFKVSAYTKHGSKIYEGEKSDIILSATTQKAGMAYETFYYYMITTTTRKDLGSKEYVELKNVSKTAGYYVTLVAISTTGKDKVMKTVKTNKAKNLITIPAKYQYKNGYRGGMNVIVRPYFNYGGKTYIGEESRATFVSKAFARKITDSISISVNQDAKGRVMNYEILIFRDTGNNTRMVTIKTYSNTRKYLGMEKQYYKDGDLEKAYSYDSRGKLVSTYYR